MTFFLFTQFFYFMSGIFLFSVKSVSVAITKVGRENFMEIVMGSGMLVRMGAPVTLFPKSVALFPTILQILSSYFG